MGLTYSRRRTEGELLPNHQFLLTLQEQRTESRSIKGRETKWTLDTCGSDLGPTSLRDFVGVRGLSVSDALTSRSQEPSHVDGPPP